MEELRPEEPRPAVLSAGSFLDGLRVHRGRPCAACGREVGLLEERHVVDGQCYHPVCVPQAVTAS